MIIKMELNEEEMEEMLDELEEFRTFEYKYKHIVLKINQEDN